jgi:hypothetical protein
MGLDVDFVFADTRLKKIKELLRNQPHGERRQIADEIGEFYDYLKERYTNE